MTKEEEARLAKEVRITMADMGFGLTREGVMAMAFSIVEITPLKVVMLGEAGMKDSWHAMQGSLFVLCSCS